MKKWTRENLVHWKDIPMILDWVLGKNNNNHPQEFEATVSSLSLIGVLFILSSGYRNFQAMELMIFGPRQE